MSEGEDVEIIGDGNDETDEDLSIELNKLKVTYDSFLRELLIVT